jgi:hypothetical protein
MQLQTYVCLALSLSSVGIAQVGKPSENNDLIQTEIRQHQYDISKDGRTFLLSEAQKASFFLLGELHGENEMPALLRDLWRSMWQDGYRYIASELSPWAANQLEFVPADRQRRLLTLWSKEEALFIHLEGAAQSVLWGCDMDEEQAHLLIRELAAANPANSSLQGMVEITKSGYKRQMAPGLLDLMPSIGSVKDVTVNDTSLAENIRATLEIESYRLNAETKLAASQRRELLMKELFLQHYQRAIPEPGAKVMLRFGRNHLHRGYDERGVSTLGNFVAEFALSQHKTVFNVAAFGAGGIASLAGETWNADERGDDLGFDFLASAARYPTTVFDLRPLRDILHRIPQEKRSPLQQRLVYWADSYDAIICYKNVTPLAQ